MCRNLACTSVYRIGSVRRGVGNIYIFDVLHTSRTRARRAALAELVALDLGSHVEELFARLGFVQRNGHDLVASVPRRSRNKREQAQTDWGEERTAVGKKSGDACMAINKGGATTDSVKSTSKSNKDWHLHAWETAPRDALGAGARSQPFHQRRTSQKGQQQQRSGKVRDRA